MERVLDEENLKREKIGLDKLKREVSSLLKIKMSEIKKGEPALWV